MSETKGSTPYTGSPILDLTAAAYIFQTLPGAVIEELLGLQDKSLPPEDKEVKGIEMEGDFDGEMEDIPPNEDSDGDEEGDEDRLQQEMGDIGNQGDTVDERLWGEDDKPEEQQEAVEKKEKDSSVQVKQHHKHYTFDRCPMVCLACMMAFFCTNIALRHDLKLSFLFALDELLCNTFSTFYMSQNFHRSPTQASWIMKLVRRTLKMTNQKLQSSGLSLRTMRRSKSQRQK